MLKDKTLCQFLNIEVEVDKPFIITHNGKEVYGEYVNGYWWKHEYDSGGNEVYFEDSSGYWRKYEHDAEGNETYYENSEGIWWKKEYDTKGNQIYHENSYGHILDKRPRELTLDEIAEKFGIPVEKLKIKKD